MDDLRILRDCAPDQPLPTPEHLAPARDRLLAATTAHRPRRWRPFVIGTAVAAAAAVTLIIVNQPAPTPAQHRPTIAAPAKPHYVDAADVLNEAATAARNQPSIVPAPTQFLYTKSTDGSGIRESWRSVDGTHDGLVINQDMPPIPLPGCVNGRTTTATPCTPDPAYRTDLPTDPDAMLSYLENGSGDINTIGKNILELSFETELPPQAQAALFEAAAKLPGLHLIQNATDAAGRKGIGVAWSASGNRSGVLVFNPTTHAYLGMTTGMAVLQQAIVNQVGQRP